MLSKVEKASGISFRRKDTISESFTRFEDANYIISWLVAAEDVDEAREKGELRASLENEIACSR